MLVKPATGESAVEIPSSASGEQSAAADPAAALSAIGGEGVGVLRRSRSHGRGFLAQFDRRRGLRGVASSAPYRSSVTGLGTAADSAATTASNDGVSRETGGRRLGSTATGGVEEGHKSRAEGELGCNMVGRGGAPETASRVPSGLAAAAASAATTASDGVSREAAARGRPDGTARREAKKRAAKLCSSGSKASFTHLNTRGRARLSPLTCTAYGCVRCY